jgi:hypothetical protein
MKNVVTFLVIVGSLLLTLSSQASAWYCVARSTTGASGWATHYSLARAQRNALYQCARRTPRGYMCYVTGCM